MNKKLLSIILLLILTVSIIAAYMNIFYLNLNRRGLLLKFTTSPNINLNRDRVEHINLDWNKVEIQVKAIHPDKGEVNLYTGFLNKPEIFFSVKNKTFRSLLESWVKIYGKSLKKDSLSTSLMIDVWIFLANNTVLETRPFIVISYEPYEALHGLETRFVSINPHLMRHIILKKGIQMSSGLSSSDIVTEYEWREISNYSYHSGLINIPILIVKNSYNISGVIIYSIGIDKAVFKITVAYGSDIVERAPNVDLSIYSLEYSIFDHYYFADSAEIVEPNKASWIYIKGGITHVHERKYIIYRRLDGEVIEYKPTDEERMKEYINSISIDEYSTEGGCINGLPPQNIMKVIYNRSILRHPFIPGTPLSDGKLSVNQGASFWMIFKYYNMCYGPAFEIGIPTGAIISTLASNFPSKYTKLINNLMISLLVYGWGILMNHGRYQFPTYSVGFNVDEQIYIRIIEYQYNSSNNNPYNVSEGIFIDCR